jgi:hypothetical protein
VTYKSGYVIFPPSDTSYEVESNGDVEVNINSFHQIDDVMSLMRQAFEKHSEEVFVRVAGDVQRLRQHCPGDHEEILRC